MTTAERPLALSTPFRPTLTVVVRAPIAPLYAEAKVSSPQVSQRLAGHELTVLDERDEWLRVRGSDGYEGWAHCGYLHSQHGTAPTYDRLSLDCVVRDGKGQVRPLPLGALVHQREEIIAGQVVPVDERQERFPTVPEAIVESAPRRFAGTSYQWGGITPWGADCSGFVQSIFWLHGVVIPRDAWQQARAGDDAGRDPLDLAPADLLFFTDRADRRITHVGLATGDGHMAHLALGRGGWNVDDLRAVDDPYVAKLRRRFVAARRMVPRP